MNDDVNSLITQCWSKNPENRPTFNEIGVELQRIQFNILPGVDSGAVSEFLSDVDRRQREVKNN
jgi:hypothetical protein